MRKNTSRRRRRGSRVFSMRFIVTAVAVAMVTGAVVGAGAVAERQARRALTSELETRLVLEARNLALMSAPALLTEFPELTLHPAVKEMAQERPDLAVVYVTDHANIIQGHADLERLGTTPRALGMDVQPVQPTTQLHPGESLRGNRRILVVDAPILHPNGGVIGTATVGLERTHVEADLVALRKKLMLFLLPVLVLAVLVTSLLMSRLLFPIATLRAGLERLGRGNFESHVRMSTRTELGILAQSINDTAARLKAARENLIDKERLGHEMALAREIQQSLLPKDRATVGNFVIEGAQRAAAEVGGDYFDIFPLRDGKTGVVIADVAGKGLAGCLVTSMLAVLIRTLRNAFTSPRALLIALEEGLIDSLQPGTFVTILYGILDSKTGRFTFASAAQNPVSFFDASTGCAESHRTEGTPLGLARGALDATLKDHSLILDTHDVLVLTTDGLTEATSSNGEEFGFRRFEKALASLGPLGCRDVLDGLQDRVREWEASLPALDDKTLVVIAHTGAKRADDAASSDDAPAGLHEPWIARLWERRVEGHLHFAIPATLDALDGIGAWLQQCDRLERLSRDELGQLELGLYEICANIVEHGYGLDAKKQVDLWWVPPAADAEPPTHGYFLIRDWGRSADPESWQNDDPDLFEAQLRGRGLGMALIQKVIGDIKYVAATDEGNLTIVKFAIEN